MAAADTTTHYQSPFTQYLEARKRDMDARRKTMEAKSAEYMAKTEKMIKDMLAKNILEKYRDEYHEFMTMRIQELMTKNRNRVGFREYIGYFLAGLFNAYDYIDMAAHARVPMVGLNEAIRADISKALLKSAVKPMDEQRDGETDGMQLALDLDAFQAERHFKATFFLSDSSLVMYILADVCRAYLPALMIHFANLDVKLQKCFAEIKNLGLNNLPYKDLCAFDRAKDAESFVSFMEDPAGVIAASAIVEPVSTPPIAHILAKLLE